MSEKKEKIDFKYNLKLYLSFVKNYKLLIFGILLTVLIVEATSIADKYLFKIITDRGSDFSSKLLSLDSFIYVLTIVAFVYLSLVLLRSIVKFAYLHFINILDSNLIIDMKRFFFNHLLLLDYNFHTSHKTGSLISKLIRVGSAVERMTDVFIMNVLPLIFQLTVAVLSIIYFSLIPAIIILLTVVVFVFYSLHMQKIQESSNVESNEAEDREKAGISDIFTNIESIKYFGKEDLIKNRYKKLSQNTRDTTLKFWHYFRWMESVQNLILSLGIFFLVYFTVKDFIEGKSSLGTLVFIYTVFISLIGSLFAFVWGIRNFYRAMADFESLFKFAKISNAIKDKPNAKDLEIKNGKIEFENIKFSYDKRIIFNGLNLTIPAGKKYALVGHSGSGKTTMVKLLYRLFDVTGGKIKIDEKDIKEFKQESVRNSMSIVPQECILFDDSIYNNVKFSNPQASKEQVMKEIKFAQLDKIIKNFPKKENTIVGERGVKLSGGEKQRVSIARAILADKKVLVLDEATSALDSQTEHDIKQDLEELMKGRTSIIIAHRLSTIMSADKIIVMKNGKIIQMGNHNELIKEEGEYKKLWNLQKGGYIK